MVSQVRVFHIDFAKLGIYYIGGGETVMIEFVKYLVSKKINNIILTTDNGKETYIKADLKEGKFISYKTINTFDFETKHHKFVSYIQKTKKAIELIRKLKLKENDKVIVYNEFFPNTIPTYLLAKRNKKIPIFYWIHMVSPSILKGFEGEFINKIQFPKPETVHYKLNQLLVVRLFCENGKFILDNPYYWRFFRKYVPRKKVYIIKNFGWANPSCISKTRKEYDLLWMGRFHQQKGLFEMIDIFKKVKKRKKDIKLLLLGDGNKKIKNKLFEKIKKNGLDKNIIYKGFVLGKEKEKLIKKCKIFIMTSYFEGLPLTISEITNLGIPIVAYNLPVYEVVGKGMTKVKLRDNKKFAQEILKLLNKKDYYNLKLKETKEYAKMHNKKVAGKEIFNLVLKAS